MIDIDVIKKYYQVQKNVPGIDYLQIFKNFQFC